MRPNIVFMLAAFFYGGYNQSIACDISIPPMTSSVGTEAAVEI